MEIILVRHALPVREENVEDLANPPLAEIGWEQARRLADWLSHEPIHHIAVSPKQRAIDTATPLIEKTQLEPEIIQEFAEMDRSASLYIPLEEMRREGHPQYKKLMNREWDAAGMMEPKEFQAEVIEGYKKLIADWDDGQTVVIVAHGGTINAIISYVLDLKDVFFCEIDYTAIARIKAAFGTGKEHLRLYGLNGTAHLHSKRYTLEPLPKI